MPENPSWTKALEKHCEGCDEDRLDVRLFGFKTPEGEFGQANWCPDCEAMAAFSGAVGASAGGNYVVWLIVYDDDSPDPDIRPGGKHAGDPWCDPSAR